MSRGVSMSLMYGHSLHASPARADHERFGERRKDIGQMVPGSWAIAEESKSSSPFSVACILFAVLRLRGSSLACVSGSTVLIGLRGFSCSSPTRCCFPNVVNMDFVFLHRTVTTTAGLTLSTAEPQSYPWLVGGAFFFLIRGVHSPPINHHASVRKFRDHVIDRSLCSLPRR
jgi:hypothetical protein